MSLPDPDLPLLRELQQGNDAALDSLMERHSGGLFRFIYRYVLNEEDARDLLQETFVRAYFKRHQFQPRARISTWLYRIALNLCRDHARSRPTKEGKLTESLALPREEIAGASRTPSDHAETNEDLILLEKAIHSLPHDLRTALILAVLEEKPQEECARLLGVSRKAVETRVYRARKLLAERLSSSGLR
jgi:RNA polymerase sigma-70 factor (ECF subfamily)